MRKKRRAYDPLAPLTPRELRQQANQLLNAGLAGPRQQINRDRAEARRQAQEDADMIQGFSSALASLLGGTGTAVDKAYSGAADRQQRIAQGYSLGQKIAGDKSAGQSNLLLQQQGITPSIKSGPGSQVTYALGGIGPSTYLNQTGTALAAAAHQLPGLAAGRGQQDLAQRLSEGEKEQQKFRSALEDLYAKGQASLPEILMKLQQFELSKRATGTQERYLGLAQSRESFDQSLDLAKLGAAQKGAGTAARKTRTGAFATAKEKAFASAEVLAQGSVNPGGDFLPNVVPTYQQAYTKLWNRYGQGLMQYAPARDKNWWRRQIKAMINNALITYGFEKPSRPKKKNQNQTWRG